MSRSPREPWDLPLRPSWPKSIIGRSLLRVGQGAIGFGRLFEFLLGLLIPGITVGVKQEGQAGVGPLDVLRGGVSGDFYISVVIPSGHYGLFSWDSAANDKFLWSGLVGAPPVFKPEEVLNL